MRRLAFISRLLFAAGAAMMLAGVLLGVAAGGVPYPDGPNSGHVAAPGAGRTMDRLGELMLFGGILIFAAGILGLLVAGITRLVRRA